MIPATGFLLQANNVNKPVVPVLLPLPHIGLYSDGLAESEWINEPDELPSQTEKKLGNGYSTVGAGFATDSFGFRLSLILPEAYGVLLIDAITLPKLDENFDRELCGNLVILERETCAIVSVFSPAEPCPIVSAFGEKESGVSILVTAADGNYQAVTARYSFFKYDGFTRYL